MHTLRHTHCILICERAGVPINIARQLMGHESIEVYPLDVYTHKSEESLQKAKELINSAV